MAKANKTQQTDASVEDFLARVEPTARREDARKLAEMLRRVTGEEPRMWGPTIVGYGRYRYRYDSGREGEAGRIGFSPRKPAMVLYIADGFSGRQALMDRLGKHTTGKCCLYIKRLADVDMAVLEELARESLAYMEAKYPK